MNTSIHTLRIALTHHKQDSASLLSFDQIHAVAKAAANCGIRRIALCGGEPLEREDLPVLLMMLSSVCVLEDMRLTTNGILLPRWAKSIRGAGVQHVTVTLDTFDPGKYRRLTNGGDLTSVLAGIRALMEVGFPPATIQARLIRGVNDDEIPSLVNLTKLTGISLRLMEMTPDEAAAHTPQARMTCKEALSLAAELRPDADCPHIFRMPDAAGSVSFIAPDQRDAGCLCLSADGMLSALKHAVDIRLLPHSALEEAVGSLVF